MSELMQQIVYYENLLEIKNKTNSQLNENEVNNWQLCRTCLKATTQDDLDLRNMCVMEVQEGRMLNGLEVLRSLARLEEPGPEDDLPIKVCIQCLDKIQSFYYFNIQVRKAENILKLLANKLKIDKINNSALIKKEDGSTTSDDVIIINEDNVANEATTLVCQNNVVEIPAIVDNCQYITNTCTNPEENLIVAEQPEEEVVYTISFKEESESTPSEICDDDDIIQLDNDEECSVEPTTKTTTTSQPQHDDPNPTYFKIKRFTKNITSIQVDPNTPQQDKLPRILDNKCPICQEIFNTGQNLIKHANKFHPKARAFECRNCTAVFSKIITLYNHNQLKHLEILSKRKLRPGLNVSKFFDNKCLVCHEILDTKMDLITHAKNLHPNEKAY